MMDRFCLVILAKIAREDFHLLKNTYDAELIQVLAIVRNVGNGAWEIRRTPILRLFDESLSARRDAQKVRERECRKETPVI